VTLVNRLKTVPPHFVPHVKAPAPKIIMRRSSDLGKDRDPGARRHSPHDQKFNMEVRVFIAALAELPNPASSDGRALACVPATPAVAKKALDSHPQLKGRLTAEPQARVEADLIAAFVTVSGADHPPARRPACPRRDWLASPRPRVNQWADRVHHMRPPPGGSSGQCQIYVRGREHSDGQTQRESPGSLPAPPPGLAEFS
jgi:hypothetical protein